MTRNEQADDQERDRHQVGEGDRADREQGEHARLGRVGDRGHHVAREDRQRLPLRQPLLELLGAWRSAAPKSDPAGSRTRAGPTRLRRLDGAAPGDDDARARVAEVARLRTLHPDPSVAAACARADSFCSTSMRRLRLTRTGRRRRGLRPGESAARARPPRSPQPRSSVGNQAHVGRHAADNDPVRGLPGHDADRGSQLEPRELARARFIRPGTIPGGRGQATCGRSRTSMSPASRRVPRGGGRFGGRGAQGSLRIRRVPAGGRDTRRRAPPR